MPEGIPMDIAALIPCSAITGYSAVMKIKPVIGKFSKFMDEVALLIVGAGGVGLWGIQIAKAVMPKNSKIFLAEVALQTRRKLSSLRPQYRKGCLLDFVASNGTVQVRLGSVIKGGTVISVGFYGEFYSFNACTLPMSMLTLKGSQTGTKDDIEEVGKLIVAGKITGPPITHVTLDEVNEVFDGL